MKIKRTRLCNALWIGLLLAGVARAGDLAGKKLVSYGADWPNTAYVRANIREMEKHPFDGIVIGLSESREPQLNGPTLGLKAWGKQKFDAKAYQHAIDDLKGTKFQTFADNFLQVEAMPGDVDFFSSDWEAVIHNFRILARAAKEGGCVGLEFDPEEYSDEHVWSPALWSEAKRGGRTEEQYIAQARARGEQLMRAINEEFPGIRILCLFGPSLSANYQKIGEPNYRLLAPFIEGMCRGADANSEIIDGYEQSYGYRTPLAFEHGRRAILASRETFQDKASFDRVVRVGYGLWNDNNSGQRGWYPDDPSKNHFTPITWQNAVNGALAQTDRYVWVWREQIHEWEGKRVGQAYEEAMRSARKGTAEWVVRKLDLPEGTKNRFALEEPRDWQSTLGDRLQSASVVIDLTTPGWEFRPDGQTDWSPIETGKFWEEQGWDYDGVAWFRRSFDLASVPEGKIEIVFGAVDETAEVTLNGQFVGKHDLGEVGWDQRFAIDITGKLRAGKNELLVRVTDLTGPGGIWKPVAIFREHTSTTNGKKLIEYGWDCPDTAYVRDHIREMEKRPFDGVVIRPTFPATQPGKRASSLGRTPFQRRRFEPAEYEHCIDDLKDTHFEKFTDNFIQVLSQPGDVGWEDDEGWNAIAHNVGVLAKIARAGKCAGLMLDPEEYGPNKIWSGAGDAEIVRRRGEQSIRAVNAELPNTKILCLFGPGLTFGKARAGKMGESNYRLLAPFIEGMCRGADAGTQIIDGCEQSYMYRTRASFAAGRQDMLLARQSFADPALFDRKMRIGFGLWIDNGSNDRPWDVKEFNNNYFQPATWQNAIHFGLATSDDYVWVYSQALDWWSGRDVAAAYETAQQQGRDRPGVEYSARDSKVPAKYIPRALATKPVGLSAGTWEFATDPNGPWLPIEPGKFWEEQGFDHDGYGWYRSRFRYPDRPKKMALHIGAADESATVWLNGKEVGTHDIGENGWDQPFEFDVTRYLKPGDGENELIIRVLDRAGAGGLWKQVWLSAR